jgi:hypothetical protein
VASDDISAALGADLFIGGGDFQLAGNGDIALVSQLDMVSQRLYLECLPDAGGVLLHPELGAGLASAVQEPLTQELADTLASSVERIVSSDPAVTSVQEVVVEQPQPKALQVTPVVTLVGGLAVPLQLPKVF